MPAPDRPEEAIERCRRALAARADKAAAFADLGIALGAAGRFSEAALQFRAALAHAPDMPELQYRLGTMLLAAGQLAEAEACFQAALQQQPDHAGAHNNLGNALRSQGRHEAAIVCYDRALALRPEYVGIRNNIGSALLALHRPVEAIPYFQDTLAAWPDYAEACNNLGGAMLALDRLEEAAFWFHRAVELEPDLTQARLGEALALLGMGDFQRGWVAYESRWPNAQGERPEFTRPRWQGGDDVGGRTILLHAEQGLGDTIQFVRYAPLLRARGARVVLSVPGSLTRLFAGLADGVVAQGETLPPHDLQCPMMSLPLAFGTEQGTIPASTPYLRADPARVAQWAMRLGPRRGRRVGIAWSGSADHPEDTIRSIPLAIFLPPLRAAGVELHVLQTDIPRADQETLEAAPDIQVHRTLLDDFAATAALIACLDLVISVDTSVAHLAGALGVPTWLLLQYSADFRWMRDRPDSPWYPTMRLFRQPALQAWPPVLAAVAAALG